MSFLSISTLLEITGIDEDTFFFEWNMIEDNDFKTAITNQLWGHNIFDNIGVVNPVLENNLSVMPVSAYRENDGTLHVICSIVSGYKGFTYNIQVNDLQIYDRNHQPIAMKSFGYITDYVENPYTAERINGISYGKEFFREFVFEPEYVNAPFADIRFGMYQQNHFSTNNIY